MSADWREELRSMAEAATPEAWVADGIFLTRNGRTMGTIHPDKPNPLRSELSVGEYFKACSEAEKRATFDARLASLGWQVPGLVEDLTEIAKAESLPEAKSYAILGLRAVQRAVEAQR